ncbi:MAG: hypothetical protein FWE19_06340 [Oscillospiraceae bacterium]|nr:hypothetical protein [Oscillospiraceae bacterium]
MCNKDCCNRKVVSCQRSCECRHVERVVCRRVREKECRPICRRTEEIRGNWQNCGRVGHSSGGSCQNSGFEGAGEWIDNGQEDDCSQG